MCVVVVINRGEKEIETPEQFKEHFGFEPIIDESLKTDGWDKCCLCNCHIAKTLHSNKIEFKISQGDYYVGMLDEVKED